MTLAAPPLFGWAKYDFLPGQSFCFCKWPSSVSYTFFMVIVCFCGPLVVMAFCYTKIIIECKKCRERTQSKCAKQERNSAEEKRKRSSAKEKVEKDKITEPDENSDTVSGESSEVKQKAIFRKSSGEKYKAIFHRIIESSGESSEEKQKAIARHSSEGNVGQRENASTRRDAKKRVTIEIATIPRQTSVVQSPTRTNVMPDMPGDACTSPESPVYFLPAMSTLSIPPSSHKTRRFTLPTLEEDTDDSVLDSESGFEDSAISIFNLSPTADELTASSVSVVSDLSDGKTSPLCKSWRASVGDVPDATLQRTSGGRLQHPGQRLSSVTFQKSREKLKKIERTLMTQPSEVLKMLRRRKRREKKQEREIRLAKLFLIVVCAFVISWFPFCITMFWSVFGTNPVPRVFDMMSLLMGYSNSCYNPIIYGALNRNFREGYKNLFRCRRLQKQRSIRQRQRKASQKKKVTNKPKKALRVECPKITVTNDRQASLSVSNTSDCLSNDDLSLSYEESVEGNLSS